MSVIFYLRISSKHKGRHSETLRFQNLAKHALAHRFLALFARFIEVARREWDIHMDNSLKLVSRPTVRNERTRRLSAEEEGPLLTIWGKDLLPHVQTDLARIPWPFQEENWLLPKKFETCTAHQNSGKKRACQNLTKLEVGLNRIAGPFPAFAENRSTNILLGPPDVRDPIFF